MAHTTTSPAREMDYGEAFREVGNAARKSDAGTKANAQPRNASVDYGKAFEQVAQSARQGKPDGGTAR